VEGYLTDELTRPERSAQRVVEGSGGALVRRLIVSNYSDRFHSPMNLPSVFLIKSTEIGMKDEGNLPSSIDAMTRKFPFSSPGVSQKACTSTQ